MIEEASSRESVTQSSALEEKFNLPLEYEGWFFIMDVRAGLSHGE